MVRILYLMTHYPSKKRPFYAMDDPADPTYTLSFDLLYHGLEITTGGQRIHDYQMLLDKIEKRGMTTEGMEQYLAVFKYGMPPHGGLGIGLERLTMKLVGEDNVRETTLFPREFKPPGTVNGIKKEECGLIPLGILSWLEP